MKNLKNAQEFYNQAVSIPIFFQLKKNSQLKIIKEIKKLLKVDLKKKGRNEIYLDKYIKKYKLS